MVETLGESGTFSPLKYSVKPVTSLLPPTEVTFRTTSLAPKRLPTCGPSITIRSFIAYDDPGEVMIVLGLRRSREPEV